MNNISANEFCDVVSEEGFYIIVCPDIPGNVAVEKVTFNPLASNFNSVYINRAYGQIILDPNKPGHARYLKVCPAGGDVIEQQLQVISRNTRQNKIRELQEEIEKLKNEDD